MSYCTPNRWYTVGVPVELGFLLLLLSALLHSRLLRSTGTMYNSSVMARKKKVVEETPAETLEAEVFSGVPVVEQPQIDTVGGIFEDFDEPQESDIVLPLAEEVLPPLDEGFSDDEKKVFVDLIKKFSTPEQRAAVLAKLATFTDTKRAPVALRAIQEINALTGVSGNTSMEAPPMFSLPKDSKVSISITKVVK